MTDHRRAQDEHGRNAEQPGVQAAYRWGGYRVSITMSSVGFISVSFQCSSRGETDAKQGASQLGAR